MNFLIGAVAGLVLSICIDLGAAKNSSVQTPYWTLNVAASKLYGHGKYDDMDLTTCNVVKGDKSPCVVQRNDDFFQREIQCVGYFERLKACEKNEIDR